MFTFKKSSNITFKLLLSLSNLFKIFSNLLSISKQITSHSFLTSSFVSAPAPGPISIIKSFLDGVNDEAILLIIF